MNKHFYKAKQPAALKEIPPRIRELAAQVLENQLSADDPAFVRETLERLTAAGMAYSQARNKILNVLIRHIYDVVSQKHQFNENRYKLDLSKLK